MSKSVIAVLIGTLLALVAACQSTQIPTSRCDALTWTVPGAGEIRCGMTREAVVGLLGEPRSKKRWHVTMHTDAPWSYIQYQWEARGERPAVWVNITDNEGVVNVTLLTQPE